MTCFVLFFSGLDSYKIHINKRTYHDQEIIVIFYSLALALEGFKSTPLPGL